ncbi:MarR family winged helix-turn-helix transcriptional regulator [Consotaella aegiceratis]|uniref:MarR family winged helix-turn-helix transcriptional regulator n=1 Tax=Consotaella aegiceratis TaxID=3097961 RepID=UPI002F3F3A21
MSLHRSESAGYLTNWAARLFARAIDKRLKALGVSSGHLPVFFALSDGGELSQKALTQIAAIEQPTMAATLARMERDGLVQRRADPADKRSSLISLTPVAQAKTRQVREVIDEVNAQALGRLGTADQDHYRDMLKTIIATLETDLD